MSIAADAATVGDFIRARGRRTLLRAGSPLFFEGDRSTNVYSCVSGSVRIFVTAHSGREVLIGFKHAGEQFGELSAITRRPRLASATAADDSVVAHMPGDQFLDELAHERGIAFAVLLSLAEQLQATNLRLLARDSQSARSRTGHKLAELAALRKRHHGDAVTNGVVLDITQSDLAGWIGTSRESVCRALADFRRHGVIDTGRGHIIVHDVDELVSVAGTHF
jgi:CRP/FNR family cyclic AMP-dependent transcriptional regulator